MAVQRDAIYHDSILGYVHGSRVAAFERAPYPHDVPVQVTHAENDLIAFVGNEQRAAVGTFLLKKAREKVKPFENIPLDAKYEIVARIIAERINEQSCGGLIDAQCAATPYLSRSKRTLAMADDGIVSEEHYQIALFHPSHRTIHFRDFVIRGNEWAA